MEPRDNWLKRKLITPLFHLLRQGISPKQLSLALTLGFLLSFFPVFGSHTLLCLLVIWLLRLNPGAVLLINTLAYPIIFAVYLPLIRMGEWIFNSKPLPFSIPQILNLLKENTWQAIITLWDATLFAVVAWLLVVIPLFPVLFFSVKYLLVKTVKKRL